MNAKTIVAHRISRMAWAFLLLCSAVCRAETITYTASDAVIPNPERGFFHASEAHAGNYVALDPDSLASYRQNGNISLVKRYFYLDDFVPDYYNTPASVPQGYVPPAPYPDYAPVAHIPISQPYLDNMQIDFDRVRAAGLKVIVRFAYTNKRMTPPFEDADLAQVVTHLDELTPILQQNADVIALIEAGFVGNWGEWFFTDHFTADPYDLGVITPADYIDRRVVVDKILDILPQHAVQLRTPHYKYKMYDAPGVAPTPVSAAVAHSDSANARIGHHNDCFLGSPNDAGTFGIWQSVAADQAYLAAETNYVPMGGEVCDPGTAQTRFACATALAEMAQFHWSYLNVQTGALSSAVYDQWQTEGCLPLIERRLGYRLVLEQGTFSDSVVVNGALIVDLQLRNEGWAAPFNPRGVQLILRHTTTGVEHSLPLPGEDPRQWLAGQTQVLYHGVPASVPVGDYALLLHLPDGGAGLANRPEYAIRLANEGVWEDSTGYNDLGHTVHVVPRGIDLIATAVSSAQSAQGLDPIICDVTVKNQGDVDVDSQERFFIGTYVSTDSIITKGDSLVGSTFIYGLAAGADTSLQISGTMPRYADGPHYVGAIANYHAIGVAEADTTNNALAGHTIDITQVFPDLITTAVSSATSAQSLDLITFDVTVENTGPISAHSQERFRVGVYLSTDSIITKQDSLLGGMFIYGLEAGADTSVQISGTVPRYVDGSHYVGAIVNYHAIGIEEADTTNNALAGHTIDITQVFPDLITTAVSSGASAYGGQPLAVDVTVENIGPIPVHSQERFRVGAYLSTDAIITTADTPIGAIFIYGEPDAEESVQINARIPASATGSYYLGAIANYHAIGIEEADSTNNSLAGDPIAIGGAPTAAPVLVSPIANAAIGQTAVAFHWNSVAGAAQYRLWLDETDATGAKHTLIDSVVNDTSLTVQLSTNHHYDWWILGLNTNGEGPWSPKASFTVGAPAPTDPAVLVNPADNATVNTTAVTLSWDAVAGAAQHRVWLDEIDANGVKQTLIDSVVNGTSLALTLSDGYQYDWWVLGLNIAGEGPWSPKASFAVQVSAGKIAALPQDFALLPNHPNPFNPSTQIGYQLPQAGEVHLVVYNALGQQVRMLEQGYRPAGLHQLSWDGRDDRGQAVAGGVYLYRLQSGAFSQTRRMLLLK